MRALRFHAAKDLRLEDIAEPKQPGPGQVLVRNRFVGICGTDLHEYSYGPIFIPTEPHPFTGAHARRCLATNLVVLSKRSVMGLPPLSSVTVSRSNRW